MTADGESLGAPDCDSQKHIFLKTVFACVHKGVLLPKYRGSASPPSSEPGWPTSSSGAPPSSTSTIPRPTSTEPTDSPKQDTIMLGDPSVDFLPDQEVSPAIWEFNT